MDEIERWQKELLVLREKGGGSFLHLIPETGDWVLRSGRTLPAALEDERWFFRRRPDVHEDLRRSGARREVIGA